MGSDSTSSQRPVRHALAMLRVSELNRRPLRKFLRALLQGDKTWRLRHPETVAWLARHPRLDLQKWLSGVPERVEGPRGQLLDIGIEENPLEALKLGTYVGS